jgi:nitroreductase
MSDLIRALSHRHADYPVDPLFPNRWSPRSMSGAHVDKSSLMTLFEAARWAPSSNNNQPWRFVYALRGTDAWPRFFDLLVPGNQAWCKQAGALVVMASKNTFDHNGNPSITHSFDTGAAWMSLALQGSLLGLVVHGMQGFDYGKALETVGLPDGYSVEAMCAIGHPAPAEDLPEPIRAREVPNSRKPVGDFAFEARFSSAPK